MASSTARPCLRSASPWVNSCRSASASSRVGMRAMICCRWVEVRMFLYFAYGSVLSKRHVGEWAGEHGVDARLFARGAPAVLRGYSLTFDVESRFWGGRVANLREDKDDVVHGVLFEIPVPARDAVLK